jgi:hypothetical protein
MVPPESLPMSLIVRLAFTAWSPLAIVVGDMAPKHHEATYTLPHTDYRFGRPLEIWLLAQLDLSRNGRSRQNYQAYEDAACLNNGGEGNNIDLQGLS